jgi:hypothetical protein
MQAGGRSKVLAKWSAPRNSSPKMIEIQTKGKHPGPDATQSEPERLKNVASFSMNMQRVYLKRMCSCSFYSCVSA